MQDWFSWIRVQRKVWGHQKRFSLFSMPHAEVEIDVEAGRALTFKLADGTTTCAYPVVWMQTAHGWFSTYIVESTSVPMLLSIEGLSASNDRLRHEHDGINCSTEAFPSGFRRARRDICYGTLPIRKLVDAADNVNPRQFSTVGVPPWARVRQTCQLHNVKHLGSCLRGESVFCVYVQDANVTTSWPLLVPIAARILTLQLSLASLQRRHRRHVSACAVASTPFASIRGPHIQRSRRHTLRLHRHFARKAPVCRSSPAPPHDNKGPSSRTTRPETSRYHQTHPLTQSGSKRAV